MVSKGFNCFIVLSLFPFLIDMVTSELPNPSTGKLPFLTNLFCLCRKAKKTNKDSPPWMRLYRRLTFKEIRTATDDFHWVIRRCGFSNSYKGFVGDIHKDTVTVKRFESENQRLFGREMELHSNLYHPNIVSLIGYCLGGSKPCKFIVYEHMPRGTLHDQLHSKHDSQPPLSWKKRLEICIGAARGLEFLHTGNPSIIHKDIKTFNILLDHNWVAKISGFELSILVPTSLLEVDSDVSSVVAGTPGYVDPEYFITSRVSKKSDVYSFGVVLFEVLSARKPGEYMDREEGWENRIQWCRDCVEDGRLDDIVDPRLRDQIAPECLKAYADMAYKCTNERGNERPAMDAVLKRLQLTLLLQECIEAGIPYSPSWLRSIVPPPKRSGAWFGTEIQDSVGTEFFYDVEDLLRD